MDFSPDGRYLAVQGGGPDWPLALWLWEKSKLCGMYRPAQVHATNRAVRMQKELAQQCCQCCVAPDATVKCLALGLASSTAYEVTSKADYEAVIVACAHLLQGAPHGAGATLTQVLFTRGCGSGTEASPLALTAVGSHVCRCAL